MRKISLKIIMIVIIACFLLAVIPVSAVRTAEQSVSDSLTRGGRFTVTITGITEFILLYLAPAHFLHDR